MKNRYKKFVLEAEEGIAFKVSEGTSGELVIKAQKIATSDDCVNFSGEDRGIGASVANQNLPTVSAGECAETLSVYTDKDGNNAVIPSGWAVSGVSEENTIWGKDVSLVIYRIPKEITSKINWENPDELEGLKKMYDQLVWCPVELLDADGTLDGEYFTEKFGRRNYRNNTFSNAKFHETLEGELLEQFESVKKYGGFYISRYNISKSKSGEAQSVKGVMPWTKVSFYDAKEVADDFENDKALESHLTYGAEYDSVLAWLIKSDAKAFEQIAKDSTQWGNHWNTGASPKNVVETGSSEKWCANNIYDFAGNVDEWTQEEYEDSSRVIRGGNCFGGGKHYPVNYRCYDDPNIDYSSTGFRVALYIK